MIKNKTPILMVSIAGTLVLTMIAINMTQYLRRPGGLEEIKAPNAEAIAKLRERQGQAAGPDGASLAAMKSTGFGPKTPGDEISAGIPEAPSIQIPTSKLYRPTFDSATTSAHWYDEDSYQKVNAKNNAGKREDPPN